MVIVEKAVKWSLVGIVGLMVLSGAGSAVVAGAVGLMGDPTVIVIVLGAFVALLSLLGVPALACGLWLWRWWRLSNIQLRNAAAFVAPDEHGRLPVPASLLRSPEFAHRAIDAHQASFLSNLSTFNYSPEHNQTLNGADGQTMAAAATTEPGTFWQLYQAGQLPQHGFLMGYSLDEDGQAITTDWRQLYSCLVGGKSGTGKSTLIRSLLAQSALQGGRFVVVDPHYNSGEESLGASLAPLRNLMLCDVAADERQIVDALNYVSAIGQRRLKGQDKERWPLVLIVDETTALFQRSNVAGALSDVLGMVAQESRKAAVYALCIGQNFDGRIMDTTIRNSFVSMISMRTRRDVARVQSGSTEFGRLVETLNIGQCVWMAPTGEMHRLAVPNCTAADLELVARSFEGKNVYRAPDRALPEVGASFTASSVAGFTAGSERSVDTDLASSETGAEPGKPSAAELATELANDERSNRAISLFLAGKSSSEIVTELWGNVTGNAKIKASQELNTIFRSHMIRLGGVNGR